MPPDAGSGLHAADATAAKKASHPDTKKVVEAAAPAAVPTHPPPSRIPAAFHMRDEAGRLIFPAQRPQGDRDVDLLNDALGAMVEEWRGRLEENKPSFPIGAARWGVLQMCMYDMWCTIEESRIWDIGLAEVERIAHVHSPQLCGIIGRIRARLAQAFATTLSMSQRLQFELQRWHSQWIEATAQLRDAEGARSGLETQVSQLRARVASLEEEVGLHAAARKAAGGDPLPLEKRYHDLQQENQRLAQQLRATRATNASTRARELSLKLSNEGLLDELARWRARLGDGPYAAGMGGAAAAGQQRPGAPPEGARTKGGGSPGRADGAAAIAEGSETSNKELDDLQPLLSLFSSFPVGTQRAALDAISRVHATLALDPAFADAGPGTRGHEGGGQARELERPASQGAARIAALQELALSLSEDEAKALISAVAARPGEDGVLSPLPPPPPPPDEHDEVSLSPIMPPPTV